jgi:hypothetical protein
MVRRIIPDSDFESDGEDVGPAERLEGTSANKDIGSRQSPTTDARPQSAQADVNPPRSVRRLVRRNSPSPAPSYSYDSDIFTEESSIGSFIVYTDDDSSAEKADSGTSSIMLLTDETASQWYHHQYLSNIMSNSYLWIVLGQP